MAKEVKMQRTTGVEKNMCDLIIARTVSTRLFRRIAGRSKAWFMLAGFLAALISSPTHAQELQGKVIGENGQPKPNVLVDILGPSKVFTQTDREGRFSAELMAGAYVVRIREGRRRMEFSRQIQNGVNEDQFQLAW